MNKAPVELTRPPCADVSARNSVIGVYAINTKRAERRRLEFASVDELVAEVDRIDRACRERGEQVRVTGNWSAGQIFQHLNKAVDASYSGLDADVPWAIRTLATLGRRLILARPFPPTTRAGTKVGGGWAPKQLQPDAQVWTDVGAAGLRAALARIQAGEPMTKPSPLFGVLAQHEWTKLHLRHAALHLSFIHIDDAAA